MSRSAFRTKHVVAAPSIRFARSGLRAVTETNAVVIGENQQLRLGAETHTRFLDRVERRDGRWGIVDRTAIYDFSFFTFPTGTNVAIDDAAVAELPSEYAALGYLLESSGFPVGDGFPVKGSEIERKIKQAANHWLDDARNAQPVG
jgi:hypothetical protein